MKIAIDCYRYVGLNNGSGGAGTYCNSLVQNLSNKVDLTVIGSESNKYLFFDDMYNKCNIHIGSTHLQAVQDVSNSVDVLYAPFTEVAGGVEFPERLPFVTAIHDLQHSILTHYFQDDERKHRDQIYFTAATRANHIITFSNVEKNNIRNKYFPTCEISVIPHSPYNVENIERSRQTEISRYRAPKDIYGKYFFYPAVNWPHKNHYRLLEAFAILLEKGYTGIKLLVSGASCVEDRKHNYKDLFQEIPALKYSVCDLGFLSNMQLYLLLRDASAVVFPSLYEGFGIPVLEALALGTPVIASDLPVFQEWFDKSFFPILNPLNSVSICKSMCEFLDNKQYDRQQPENLNFRTIFSSEVLAEATLDAFRCGVHSKNKFQGFELNFENLDDTVNSKCVTVIDLTGVSAFDQKEFVKAFEIYCSKADFFGKHKNNTVIFNNLDNEIEIFNSNQLFSTPSVQGIRNSNAALDWLLACEIDYTALTFVKVSDYYKFNDFERYIEKINEVKNSVEVGSVFRVSLDEILDDDKSLSTLSKYVFSTDYKRFVSDPSGENFIEWPDVIKSNVRRKFVYIEPKLKNMIGHYYHVAKNIGSCAVDSGLDFLVAAHNSFQFDRQDSLFIKSFFSSYDTPLPEGNSPGTFCQELKSFLQINKITQNDYVYLHMPMPYVLLGLLEYSTLAACENLPTFLIRICSDDEPYRWFNIKPSSVIKSILSSKNKRSKFKFFVESKNLQDYFKYTTDQDFPLLCNPLPGSMEIIAKKNIVRSSTVHIGYFGEARPEKGFTFLPLIIAMLIDKFQDRLYFHVQMNSNKENETQEILSAKAALYELAYQHKDRIELIFDPLPVDAYYQKISSCDIILLPYCPNSYKRRGTGIALESLALGAIIVVPANSDIAATFDGPGCLVAHEYSPLSFVDAVSRALINIDSTKQAILERRTKDKQLFKNGAEFIDALTSTTKISDSNAKIVLWIGNDTIRQGCSSVYQSQRCLFEENGFDIYNIYLPFPDCNGNLPSDDAMVQYLVENSLGWVDDAYRFDSFSWMLNQCDHDSSRKNILDTIRERSASTQSLTKLNEYYKIPNSLAEFVKNNKVDLVCLNYVHSFPVLKKLSCNAPVILETHDIQAFQHALRASVEVDNEDLDFELNLSMEASRVIVVSSYEKEIYDATFENANVEWIIPTPFNLLKQTIFMDDRRSVFQPYMLDIYFSRKDLQSFIDLKTAESFDMFMKWLYLYGKNESNYIDFFGGEECAYSVSANTDGIPKVLDWIWTSRPDLQSKFPAPATTDKYELLKWLQQYGIEEYQLDANLFPKHLPTRPAGVRFKDPSFFESIILSGPKTFDRQSYFEKFNQWAIGHESLDILIVGSDHPANLRSIRWFISCVFPYIPKHYNLVIAGRSCSHFTNFTSEYGNIYLLGELETVQPLYAAAKVVAVPVITGSGFPIKILDALSSNCAVSATKFVDRAGKFSSYGFPLFEHAAEMADDIISLLEDNSYREERIKLGKIYLDNNFSLDIYKNKWNNLLASLHI